jgi:catechol 2,3-dioxygenase-like lactoylglutathione lyase family enzyme
MRMTVQLSMVGIIVSEMPRALAFYRALGLRIPEEEDQKPFVMHRMPSGVTIFWDTVFVPTNDEAWSRPWRGAYGTILEFYLDTRDRVDATFAEMTALGYEGRRAPWKSVGPYAAIIEDPDGTAILLTAEDENAVIPAAG